MNEVSVVVVKVEVVALNELSLTSLPVMLVPVMLIVEPVLLSISVGVCVPSASVFSLKDTPSTLDTVKLKSELISVSLML